MVTKWGWRKGIQGRSYGCLLWWYVVKISLTRLHKCFWTWMGLESEGWMTPAQILAAILQFLSDFALAKTKHSRKSQILFGVIQGVDHYSRCSAWVLFSCLLLFFTNSDSNSTTVLFIFICFFFSLVFINIQISFLKKE